MNNEEPICFFVGESKFPLLFGGLKLQCCTFFLIQPRQGKNVEDYERNRVVEALNQKKHRD